MLRHVVVAAVLMAIATPALASEFYIGQDLQTKKCKVVETKPDGQTWVMIGTVSYTTKEEAKAAKKAAVECNKESAN